MTYITLISTVAMLLGLGGIVPQIFRMARARSAAGQSAIGWFMCMGAQLSMAYLNGLVFGAPLLTASNLTAATLCAIALVLIGVMGRRAPAGAIAATPATAATADLVDLATQEFVVLRDAVLAADAARRPRAELIPAAA
jgi:hypothetical protein